MRVTIVTSSTQASVWLARRLETAGFVINHLTPSAENLQPDKFAGVAAIVADCDTFAVGAETLARELRASGIRQPLLLLSSNSDWRARIASLDAGADDLAVKPVRSEEVAARLRALIRRATGNPTDQMVAGDIVLDLRANCAWHGNHCLDLTRNEFRLLRLLMLRPEFTIDYDSIWRAIHPGEAASSQNAIEVLVARLRRKIGRERIKTIRGIGYRFVCAAPVNLPVQDGCRGNCNRYQPSPEMVLDPLCYI